MSAFKFKFLPVLRTQRKSDVQFRAGQYVCTFRVLNCNQAIYCRQLSLSILKIQCLHKSWFLTVLTLLKSATQKRNPKQNKRTYLNYVFFSLIRNETFHIIVINTCTTLAFMPAFVCFMFKEAFSLKDITVLEKLP